MEKDNHQIEDRKLLWKACQGDKEAQASVSIKYRKPVCDFLRKIGSNGLAEDIYQTMFLKICDKKCNYDGGSDAKNYLFGFARKIRRQELTAVGKAVNAQNWEEIEDILWRPEFSTPAKILQQSEFRRILYEKIAQLPPKSRQAVQLVYLKGIPAKKAAMIIKCDFKVFRDRLNYGLKRLNSSVMPGLTRHPA
jgi:RNA polymerase sigma factor (sigma-70 family)